ncbi:MAG: LamG-like jellyroll fold domain-containing protein, partial [Sediminibacterium sp.]
NSGTIAGRSITGITYTHNGQQKTITPANAIKSTLVLSTLTANPVPGSDANRFWDLTATTMSESTALRVLGDFDMGTAFQDCGDVTPANHQVVFDNPIVPGAGPEIFIVHGGLVNDIQILDVAGNVVLTIPASEINNSSVVSMSAGSIFNGFYLRNKAPFSVQQLGTHYNIQSRVLALDINIEEIPQIGGIRYGGGYSGNCNYVYEIFGIQPTPSTASQIVYTSANIGTNPVILQVTDASGNSATATQVVTVECNPILPCPANISVNTDLNSATAIVNIPLATTTPCGPILSASIPGYTFIGVHKGSAYYLSNAASTFDVANTNATTRGGHLVTIGSATENQFLVTNLASGGYWIGLNDIATEGTFVWANGEPVNYTNWSFIYGQQPDNYIGLEDATIIGIGDPNSNGRWNDVPVSDSWRHILEIPNIGGVRQQSGGIASGSAFPLGTTTNTYINTNANGVISTCSVNITVIDSIAPTVVCQPITVVLDNSGTATITASQVNNGSTDNVGIVTATLSKSTFNCSDLGNSAMNFTSGQDVVATDNTASLPLGNSARTISAWINPSVIHNNWGIIGYGLAPESNRNGNGNLFAIGLQSGNRLTFWGSYADYISPAVVPLNTWTYVAVTFDGVNGVLYMNGQSYPFNPSNSHGWPLNTLASKFFVGAETDDNGANYRSQYSGSIDDVRVYSRSLSPAEIALDMQGTSQTNLVLNYTFGEGSGTTINDAANNNNPATLINGGASNWINRNIVTTTLTLTDVAGNISSCEAIVTVTDPGGYCAVSGATVVNTAKVIPFAELINPINQSKVFPNPSTDKIVVETKNDIESVKQIFLVDLVGRISPQRNTRLISKNRIEMEIAHLPKGVHYIKVMSKKGIEILTFIKL